MVNNIYISGRIYIFYIFMHVHYSDFKGIKNNFIFPDFYVNSYMFVGDKGIS